jgi:hypothetical protein
MAFEALDMGPGGDYADEAGRLQDRQESPLDRRASGSMGALFFDPVQYGLRLNVLFHFLKFSIGLVLHAQFRGKIRHHCCHFGDLMFRQQTDLKIEVSALVSRGSHPVLRNQYKCRQENSFY